MQHARVFGIALALALGLACPREDARGVGRQPTAPPTPPIGAWVRVDQQRLLWAANENSRLVVESQQPFRTAEVVGVTGDFVELQSLLVEPDHLCATTSGAHPEIRVHFFAKFDALAPVLSRPKVVELDDGTKLAFEAGVPIYESSSELVLDVGGGGTFVVPLASDEIGRWFPAVTASPSPKSTSAWSRARPLHYGERSFSSLGPPFHEVSERQPLGGNNTLLTFANACGRFTLRVENEPTDRLAAAGGLIETKGQRPESEELGEPTRCLGAGAELTWLESGTVAGWTVDLTPLPEGATEREGKVCFTVVDMPVCIASDLVRNGPPGCLTGLELVGRQTDDRKRSFETPGKPNARVLLQPAQVGEGLDPASVRRIVHAHINELHSCYTDALSKHPTLAGSVTIEFKVGLNGKVSRSKVRESSLEPTDEALLECMTTAVKRWPFPVLDGVHSAIVTYPIELQVK